MATWDSVDRYFSGQGVVLLARRTPQGLPMGFVPVGNVPALKISVATSSLEHKESHSGQRGTDLRLTTETKCSLSMTMENFIPENLALVSRGIVTQISNGTAANVTVLGYLGRISIFPHLRVSAVVVKNGASTLSAGTDYTLNSEAGSIKLANTITGFTDGTALTVDYTYETQSVVDGLSTGAEELFMRFEGLNTAQEQKPVNVEVFKISTDPFKELDLIADGVQSFVLEGSVLADNTRTVGSKYFRVQQAT